MNREKIELIPEMVKSGKVSWEQVARELVVFIIRNKPMFSLQKFDEDFISDFIISFLDKGPEAMAEYNNSKGSFFAYLFCITRNIQTSLMKKAAINNQIEYIKMTEIISNYENKIEAYKNIKYDDFEMPKVPYSYKPVSYKDFQVACKTDSYHIKKVINSKESAFPEIFKEILKDYSPKVIQNIIMVLALKSAYYITDEQIEKISELLNIDKSSLHHIIQDIKVQMDRRINNKEKFEIRRNRAYFNHRRIRSQIEWNENNILNPEYENEDLQKKYQKNTKNWSTLNHQLEEGKIHIRPTTKLIANILGLSPRQVTYYQSTAKKLGITIIKIEFGKV